MTERLRLFVACELSAEIEQALARLQTELKGRDLGRLRWVRPQGIHLTLKFLGDTPADKVAAIQEALAAACRGSPPFTLSLGELGSFGGRAPRVVWVGIGGELTALLELQKRVETALAGLGFPREERPFSPHLTLARVPREIAVPQGPDILEAVAAVAVPEVGQTVTEVNLMRSILQPAGAVYEKVATWPLG